MKNIKQIQEEKYKTNEHRTKINNEIVAALTYHFKNHDVYDPETGEVVETEICADKDLAKRIVSWISKGQVPHISINY